MIRVERDARGVAEVWLARPERHNALTAAMMDDLTAVARDLGADPAVRAVVLAGEGPTFCAGADLDWMRAQVAGGPDARRAEANRLAGMLGALDAIPRPVVARVQGNAFGGGVGLLSVCDMVVAADSARFALTEVKLGLIPATIGPYVVARIGGPAARRLFLSARPIDAFEAMRLGLVTQAVPMGGLDGAVADEIAPCLLGAPAAQGEAKRLVARLSGGVTPEAVAASIDALVARWDSPEAAEGIAAFFDRRKPGWAEVG
jgi:methylglutaconyl-CoA hydratase